MPTDVRESASPWSFEEMLCAGARRPEGSTVIYLPAYEVGWNVCGSGEFCADVRSSRPPRLTLSTIAFEAPEPPTSETTQAAERFKSHGTRNVAAASGAAIDGGAVFRLNASGRLGSCSDPYAGNPAFADNGVASAA